MYYAKPVLVPLAFGILLAGLFVPLCRRFEKWGMGKALAAASCVLMLVVLVAGIVLLLSTQIKGLPTNIDMIEQKAKTGIRQLQNHIDKTFGFTIQEQNKAIKQSETASSMPSWGTTIVTSTLGILIDILLVIVYIFLFIYFRTHVKRFFLKIVPADYNEKTQQVLSQCRKVSEQYLTGLTAMIVLLWVMYGIGFSIIGVKNALFFAILCGLLEIIPFVGNLTGTIITVLMVLSQGGGTGMVIGVFVTYGIVQFVQSYILEPLIVGSEVNINPLATIVAIVIGETIWGIAGMILAIPLVGILKIICDNIEALQPIGYLIGGETLKKKQKTGLVDRIRGWIK